MFRSLNKSLPGVALVALSLFFFSSTCFADAYTIQVLDSNRDDVYTQKNDYLQQFPVPSGVKNKKGDLFTQYPLRLFTQKKLVPLDCILQNGLRWEVIDAFGMNDKSDILVILQNRDRTDVWVLAALRATGEVAQSYCPVITWDIDKACLKNVFLNDVTVTGDDPRVIISSTTSTPRFPVTTDRELDFDFRGGLLLLPPGNTKTTACSIRITAKTANGTPIANHRFMVFGAGDGSPDQIVAAATTNRRGQASISVDYLGFVKKHWPGQCEGVTIRAQFPYNDSKVITRNFHSYIWDHCE